MDSITAVCGHEQALGQCREWLDANLPGVPRDVCGAMARQRCEPRLSPVSPPLPVISPHNYRLTKLSEAIQDIVHNTTRFFVIGRDNAREVKTRLRFY